MVWFAFVNWQHMSFRTCYKSYTNKNESFSQQLIQSLAETTLHASFRNLLEETLQWDSYVVLITIFLHTEHSKNIRNDLGFKEFRFLLFFWSLGTLNFNIFVLTERAVFIRLLLWKRRSKLWHQVAPWVARMNFSLCFWFAFLFVWGVFC